MAMHRLLRFPFYQCRSFVRAAPLAGYFTATKIPAKNTTPNWDEDDSLFSFTRGRFVYDEKRQMAQRTVRFSMKELAQVAASSIGADRCVDVKKCPDGLYNKVYVFRMDDGREVIGKVPNPNVGLPHYATASEVASMDFMRSALSTPTPKVLAWNSRAESTPVGSEFIIMEKAEGVPLGRVWGSLGVPEKAKLLFQTYRFMRAWLNNPLPGYGGLYYKDDVPSERALPVGGAHDRFVIGPAVGRDWYDADRKELECDRGPWSSALEYRRAVGAREQAAVQHLPGDTKQLVMLTGPHLYQPSPSKKLWALNAYLQVLEHVLPKASDPNAQDMLPARLWHDDLHAENIFVNSADPTQITAVIDWQSTQAAPLFDHSMDPAFLDYEGPDIGEDFSKPVYPNTTGLPEDEKRAAAAEYLDRGLMIAWRRLVHKSNPAQYQTLKFQDTTPGNILQVARRCYELGEAHLAVLIISDLRDAWPPSGSPFPVILTLKEEDRIKREADEADKGGSLVMQSMKQLGDRWPEKGLVEHDKYDETKGLLTYVRDEIAEQCFGDDEVAKRGFLREWPFDT